MNLLELKDKVDKLQRKTDKAQGALEQILNRLKTEHDCHNLEQAEILLANLKIKDKEISQKYEEELTDFTSEWADVLNKI